jgi:putative DNA primase/helicase
LAPLLAERAKEEELAFVTAIEEIARVGNVINRQKLGRWIGDHENRIVGGKRFVRKGSTGGSARWRVMQS